MRSPPIRTAASSSTRRFSTNSAGRPANSVCRRFGDGCDPFAGGGRRATRRSHRRSALGASRHQCDRRLGNRRRDLSEKEHAFVRRRGQSGGFPGRRKHSAASRCAERPGSRVGGVRPLRAPPLPERRRPQQGAESRGLLPLRLLKVPQRSDPDDGRGLRAHRSTKSVLTRDAGSPASEANPHPFGEAANSRGRSCTRFWDARPPPCLPWSKLRPGGAASRRPKRVRETRALQSGRAAPIPSLLPRCYLPEYRLFRLAFLPVLSSPCFRLHCARSVDATVFRPFLTSSPVARFDHSDGNKLFEFEAHIVAFEARGASPTPLSCRRSGVDPPAGKKIPTTS